MAGARTVTTGRPTPISPGDRGWDGDDYQARFDKRAREGANVHGEADLVMTLRPGSVLDAGCGTGRVARELCRTRGGRGRRRRGQVDDRHRAPAVGGRSPGTRSTFATWRSTGGSTSS